VEQKQERLIKEHAEKVPISTIRVNIEQINRLMVASSGTECRKKLHRSLSEQIENIQTLVMEKKEHFLDILKKKLSDLISQARSYTHHLISFLHLLSRG